MINAWTSASLGADFAGFAGFDIGSASARAVLIRLRCCALGMIRQSQDADVGEKSEGRLHDVAKADGDLAGRQIRSQLPSAQGV